MRGKLLLGLVTPMLLSWCASAAWSGEETKPPTEAPAASSEDRAYLSNKLLEDMAKNVQKHREAGWATEKEKSDANIKQWNADLDKLKDPKTGSFEYGGKTVNFTEPRRPDQVEYKAKEPYKPWSLKAEDFKFDLPVEVYESRPLGAQGLGRDRVYLVLPFTITNSLAEKKLMTPRITMVTDGGVFTPEVCGFVAHESVEVSTLMKRAWTPELVGFARESKEVTGAFEAGQTKAGVAIFPRFDPATTHVQFLVEGLAEEFNFKKDLRKVLVLEFVRPGNIYYPGQVKLAFKRRIGGKLINPKEGYLPARDDDVHHGFDWTWLWNWEAASRVSETPKSSEMATPTGAEKQKFWFYKVTIPNRTGEDQPLTIERVTTTIRVELLGKTVDVPFVDDGTLNVYKTDFFEKEGKAAVAKRFPENVKVAPGDENAVSFWVAFRESDFDFEAVCRNLANAFTLDLVKARNAGPEKTDPAAFAGVARFDSAKMDQARKELLEKLPAALADQLAKRVVARIAVKSGLASGTRAMNYSLYQPAYKPEPAPK